MCSNPAHNVTSCKLGFEYMVGNKDDRIVVKNQAGFVYADDVCGMTNNEKDIKAIFIYSISGCIREDGMKVKKCRA